MISLTHSTAGDRCPLARGEQVKFSPQKKKIISFVIASTYKSADMRCYV